MLKRIFSYMKQYKKYAFLALFCIAVEAVLELMVPMIMADLIDTGVATGDERYIYQKGFQMVLCAAAALVLFHSVAFVKDLISVFEDLFTLSGIDNMYLTILFKSLGICYIVQLASDYCKDCGENALASQVTLAGKLAMLSVSLPLFKAFVEIVKALLI
mgnify:CR=1 FL=1